MADLDAALPFLEKVFALCPPDEWISVFAIDRTSEDQASKVLWVPARRIDSLVRQIRPLVSTHCIWYGVATRKEQIRGGRGGEDDCAHLPCLYADIDISGPGHKKDDYPPDDNAVKTILSKFPAPDVVVDTGGGYHPYWFLDTPLPMPKAVQVLSGWGNSLIAAFEEAGYRLDQVFNVDRILRVPGTLNNKDPEHPIPVTILKSL